MILPPIAPSKGLEKTPEKKKPSDDDEGGLSDDDNDLRTPEKLPKSRQNEAPEAEKRTSDKDPASFVQPKVSAVNIPTRRHSCGAMPASALSPSSVSTAATETQSNVSSPRPSPGRRYSTGGQSVEQQDGKPKFNVLTLRQWFDIMDSGRNGHVTKTDWFAFLRNNLKLKHLILHGSFEVPRGMSYQNSEAGLAKRKEETAEMRKLLKAWRQMDEDGNGTMEWEEFISFFRHLGMLLEYKEGNHPTGRIADILSEVHGQEGEVDASTFEEFESLVKVHTQGDRRRSLEMTALQLKPVSEKAAKEQEGLAKRMERRHSYSGAPGAAPEPISPLLPMKPAEEVKAPEGKSPEPSKPVAAPPGKPAPSRPNRHKAQTNDSDISTQSGGSSSSENSS